MAFFRLLQFSITLVMGFSLGCNEGSFQGSSPEDPRPSTSNAAADGTEGPQGSFDNEVDGESVTDSEDMMDTFRLKVQKPAEKVDYLFVLDNSCSAEELRLKSQQAMSSLVGQVGILPADAKIATMTTAHGMKGNLKNMGVGYADKGFSSVEPGFLSFYTSGARSALANKKPGLVAKKYPIAGCENEWFSPDETNDAGELCIEAAFQSANTCTNTEAGILAFIQLLDKNKGRSLFRDGSIVNVIFISDTHDPGIRPGANADAIIAQHLPYKDLKAKVEKDNKIAGLKFHTISPSSEAAATCGEGNYGGGSYNILAAASQGKSMGCSGNVDYQGFMKDMVILSKYIDSETFSLSQVAGTISSVKVNGKEVTDYDVDLAANTITVKGLAAGLEGQVEVVYKVK